MLPGYYRSSPRVKVGVSRPDDDVRFLDAYARERGFESRSAALHKAVKLLRAAELGAAMPMPGRSGPVRATPISGRRSPATGSVPMRRGEIRLVDLDLMRGAEASKRRPAVIVSNDGAHAAAAKLGRGVVTVVPVTANVARVYPFQVLLTAADTGLPVDSKAQAEHVRSVAVERVGKVVGAVGPSGLNELADALRLHLAL